MARLPDSFHFPTFTSNKVSDGCPNFSQQQFSKTFCDWLSVGLGNLGFFATAGVKVMVLISSHLDNNCLKFLTLYGEFPGFWRIRLVLGAILDSFDGCNLFKLGALGDSILFFFVFFLGMKF